MAFVFRVFPGPPRRVRILDALRFGVRICRGSTTVRKPWSSQNQAAEEFLVRSRLLGCFYEISIGQASLSRQAEDRVGCRGDELIFAGLERHAIAVRSRSTATLGVN